MRAFFSSSRINSRNFSGRSLSAAMSRILMAPCSCRRANVIIACSAYNPFCEIFNSRLRRPALHCAPFQPLCLEPCKVRRKLNLIPDPQSLFPGFVSYCSVTGNVLESAEGASTMGTKAAPRSSRWAYGARCRSALLAFLGLEKENERLVPSKGLEPPHRCRYMDLNHARLPIPPRWQVDFNSPGSP